MIELSVKLVFFCFYFCTVNSGQSIREIFLIFSRICGEVKELFTDENIPLLLSYLLIEL